MAWQNRQEEWGEINQESKREVSGLLFKHLSVVNIVPDDIYYLESIIISQLISSFFFFVVDRLEAKHIHKREEALRDPSAPRAPTSQTETHQEANNCCRQ